MNKKSIAPENEKKEWPAVSIIVLTYNGARFIDNLTDSLLKQDYPGEKYEILLVDNHSTDDTFEKITEKGGDKIRAIRFDRNLGYAGGNNKALQYAKYDYVAFLNQDTVCHRNWLMGLVKGLEEHESIGACTSNMIICSDGNDIQRDLSAGIPTLNYYDITLFGYARYFSIQDTLKPVKYTKLVSGCSFIIKKKILTQWGYLFDKALQMYTEDTDLSLRIQNAGSRVCVSRDSVVYHLHGNRDKIDAGLLQRVIKAIKNRVFVFFMNMSLPEFIIFFPFLFLGSPFKIFEFSIPRGKKFLYFLPFSMLSLLSIFLALFQLSKFLKKRERIIAGRPAGNSLFILKLLLKRSLS